MCKYTIYGGEVDDYVEKKLNFLVKEMVKSLPGIVSILLVGGFGKGEGSVKISQDGHITLLKDFDFILVFKNKIPKDRVKEVEEKLQNHISGNSMSSPYKYSRFTIDLNATSVDRICHLADITTYDAKYSSILLYGQDIRNRILVTQDKIPLRSGARVLFQKGISLLGQLSYSYLFQGVPERLKDMFIYETAKVFVELGTALTILARKYYPKCIDRSKFLLKNYKKLFPELYEKIPDLAEKIDFYVKFKLAPDYNLIKDPIKLWFSAKKYHRIVLEYYMSKFLNIDQYKNLIDYCEKLKRKLYKDYYKSLIANFIYFRFKIKSEFLSLLLNKVFQIYEFYCFAKNVLKNARYDLCFTGVPFFSPSIDFFISTILLLNALKEGGRYNREYVVKARHHLRIKPKPTRTISQNSWEETRLIYLDALRMLPFVL